MKQRIIALLTTGLLILIMPYSPCQFSALILEKVSYF